MPKFTIALSDIPEGVPHKLDGAEVVLIREGETVTALTSRCPHLGLPLSKGVVRDGTLICAFHHACFDARDGRQVQPPGHGDLRRYEVDVRGDRVSVSVPEDAEPHVLPAGASRGVDPRRVVIAGAGAAALSCALTLRGEGYEGAIEMIAPGAPLPYDRTMLSKGVLSGDKTPDDLALVPAAALRERDIARIDGRVVRVEPGRVHLEDGGTHAFDALVLAPGGTPRRPDLPGAGLSGVHVLRGLPDAEALVAAAGEAGRAVLVGGGFIGLEGALSLAKRGLDVTVVTRDEIPLAKVVGSEVGRVILAETEARGVRFVTGSLAEVTGEGRAAGVRLEDGTEIAADLVLLAMGVSPATAGIEGLPLDEDGGVSVGADLSVSGAEMIFVAGDAARAPTPFGPARIEHWRVAQQHGRRAALSILGAQPERPDIPFFWTALDRQYRYVGHAGDWDRVEIDGDPSGPFLARYVKSGRVMAAFGAGRDADLARLHLEMTAAGGPLPQTAEAGA
jgi:NADPH-dependent 2,4-dienoyl-CoA reductase/sulfur reductase-like enzyme/nitrite reductase/ring-hydroxylating ferredoxin subunit